MAKNTLQKLMDSGVEFTEMSRKQAEEAVQNLVKAGEIRRSDAEATVQTLLERGKETAARLAEIIQGEVAKQLGWLANRVDDLEDQLEGFVSRFGPNQAVAPAVATTSRAKKLTAKKSTAKKSTAKKSTAKKSTAKKSTAKKSTAKKSTARKSTAKKAVGTSGVRKVATTRTG